MVDLAVDFDSSKFSKGGYRQDLEDYSWLRTNAQNPAQFCYGDIDPKNLGQSLGMTSIIHNENQYQINSCAGNSGSTLLETGLYHQSKGKIRVQLSRMFAYANGQKYCGINGDNGATLTGVLKGFHDDGCPLESLAPYSQQYYTQFSAEAYAEGKARKLTSWAEVNDVSQVYEGLSKRVGGLYLGIPWTDVCSNPRGGVIESYSSYRTGCHAICVLDWVDSKRDSRGWPYFWLFNSWGPNFGINGNVMVSPSALQNMLRGQMTSAFFLSDMQFMKPRFDWKASQWF